MLTQSTTISDVTPQGLDILGNIVEAYRREALDAGDDSVMHDVLASLVLNSEQLHTFVQCLARQIEQNGETQCFVEGGLGI